MLTIIAFGFMELILSLLMICRVSAFKDTVRMMKSLSLTISSTDFNSPPKAAPEKEF